MINATIRISNPANLLAFIISSFHEKTPAVIKAEAVLGFSHLSSAGGGIILNHNNFYKTLSTIPQIARQRKF
jgi:hypothetical protein